MIDTLLPKYDDLSKLHAAKLIDVLDTLGIHIYPDTYSWMDDMIVIFELDDD